MAEQEVRPQQLSIAEIARLWSAETGDSAEDVERELAEWAYAASADGARVGLDSGSDKKSPARLKVEPDPRRELCREDLEAFCRESDRLVPHFWPEATPALEAKPAAAPEAPKQGDGEPERAPPDMSRLVVRAMDRMGSAALAPASRRAPRESDPVEPAAADAATPVKLVADNESTVSAPTAATDRSETKAAAPGGGKDRPAARVEDMDGPRRKPSPSPRPARPAKVTRAAKKSRAAGQDRASGQESKLRPLRDIASGAQEVPIKVMASAPTLAAVPPHRPTAMPLSLIAAALLGGALIAAAGAAAWLEFKGPGLETILLDGPAAQSELAEMERRAADLAARAAKADGENERLGGQLNDARRQNDTLRARIEDISSLGPRLTETEKSNTELRRAVGELTAALDAARSGGSAAAKAIEEELKSNREALNKANAATQAARKDADALTDSLATAQGEIEAGKLARSRLVQERDAGAKTLEAANNEIENLVQSGTAAQAVVQRLEGELSASEKQLRAREADRAKLQTEVAALNKDLTETRARAARLAAAETETRRLGAALDAATLEIARLQTAAESSRRETSELAARVADERQTTAQARAEAKAAAEKTQGLTKDLALAQAANTQLRVEAGALNTQAAELSEFLATAREEAKSLKAERAAAIAKTKDLERDLASFKDESAKLRASLLGTSGASEQLAARLAAAERRATKLNQNRREVLARAEALAKELETAKKAATKQGAARAAAQDRVESLVVSMAAANAEVLNLKTEARQADEKSGLLLKAVDSWKAEAKTLAASLAALKDRAAPAAAAELRPQAGRPKEALIGTAAVSASGKRKLDPRSKAGALQVASQGTGAIAAVPKAAKGDGTAASMMPRGNEFLGRGDIASARLFFELAARQGETGALMAVGKTYDPRVLNELGVLGAFADPAAAARWYERALAAGDDTASRQLEALAAWRDR